ncbi:MAG TPA: mannitol dehydrogenase family protein [Steroidobacteraceae bacterium]|nr:mannitol dehydrogenase family protein [Steroidobacteraceae bacterium]
MTAFLSSGELKRLPAGVRIPAYDRAALQTGIVHFGPGAFHRVHQANYIDDVLHSDPRWGICAVALHSTGVRDALAPQDGLYTTAILDTDCSYRIIGALREVLVAPKDPAAVIARMIAPETRMVSATVTEKGYCLGVGGVLDFEHPEIRHDLQAPHAPSTLVGYLVEALRLQCEAGGKPFMVVSCDNMIDNGERLRRAVVQFARHFDRALADWIEAEVAFPRTMVDSITPATDDALRERVTQALGVTDRWPVQRENFLQWVIEQHDRCDLSALQAVGVTLTDDVAAYDRAKLRLLNGAHSSLAYLGSLSGFETVSQAMASRELAGFVRRLMTEDILPNVTAPRGLDLRQYIETILKRFRNPEIRHPLAQIAWDGSQKLPFRLFGTIADSMAVGRPIDRLCVPIAAWMHFVRTRAEHATRVVDPLAEQLFDIGVACRNSAASDVPRFLALSSVFPDELRNSRHFVIALNRSYDRLGMATDVRMVLR